MSTFRALLVSKTETGQVAAITDMNEDQLMPGDVTIRVSHSSMNYKDGLAVTGKSPIIRQYPLIPGIDFAGKVQSSTHPRWKTGDDVVLGGWGVGESHHGGFSQVARVNGDWLVPLNEGWKPQEAMAVGVAGFTSMLCSTPLLSSLALTIKIPSALIKKETSTFGSPAGIAGMFFRLN